MINSFNNCNTDIGINSNITDFPRQVNRYAWRTKKSHPDDLIRVAAIGLRVIFLVLTFSLHILLRLLHPGHIFHSEFLKQFRYPDVNRCS